MNERRIQRLQEQIKQRLAEVLQRDLADPKLGLVTITRVELDTEFTQCKVYWSVIAPTSTGEAKARRDSEQVLDRARGFLQREIGKSLRTRTIPRVEFVFDQGISGAIRVNTLLKELAPKPELGSAPDSDGSGSTPDAGGTPSPDS